MQTLAGPSSATGRPAPLARAADVIVGTLLLVLATPLMVLAAAAVRIGSHGPVLHREPAVAGDGRRVELLSFRTLVDGGGTEAHERVRAVIGAAETPFTGVGRWLLRLRLDRAPRLVNVVAGHVSLFG